jgi:hypothetical protein
LPQLITFNLPNTADGYDGKPVLQLERNFDTIVPEFSETKQLSEEAADSLLYDASSVFLKELYLVHASLLVFRVIGLNAKAFSGPGAEFVHFSSLLAQRAIVLGLESLFERKDDGAGLCSVKGLLLVAQRLKLKNKTAATTFVAKYGVEPTDDWYSDVQKVLGKQEALIGQCVKLTARLRNQRVAHLSHPPLKPRQYLMPSVGTTEQVIAFAHDFYTFIVTGFLACANGAELKNSIGESVFSLLKNRFGVQKAKYDFPEEAIAVSSKN